MRQVRRSLALGMMVAPVFGGVASGETAADWDVTALRLEATERGYTFEAGDSWVTEFLADGGDIARITGLEMPIGWEDHARFVAPATEEVRIPDDFDWRLFFKDGLQPIRNQGSCGSCWAFAVTAVIESLHNLKYGRNPLDLAEQTLVSSCSSAGSCAGGYFSAFDYTRDRGLPAETDDPYQARNSHCRPGLKPAARITQWAYIGAKGREPTVEEIKAAIYNYGPVAVTVNASFGSYSSGVYNRCNSGRTNHMVTIEGWNEAEGYWIVRNSWGNDWGENGYIRIKFNGANGGKCNNIGEVAAFAVVE